MKKMGKDINEKNGKGQPQDGRCQSWTFLWITTAMLDLVSFKNLWPVLYWLVLACRHRTLIPSRGGGGRHMADMLSIHCAAIGHNPLSTRHRMRNCYCYGQNELSCDHQLLIVRAGWSDWKKLNHEPILLKICVFGEIVLWFRGFVCSMQLKYRQFLSQSIIVKCRGR